MKRTMKMDGDGGGAGPPLGVIATETVVPSMNPDEMQTSIEHLREGAHVLFAIADEPGQTSVHPSGTIKRERVETRASNADVEDVFGFVTD